MKPGSHSAPIFTVAPQMIDYSAVDPRFSDFTFRCTDGPLYFYRREMAMNEVMKSLCSCGTKEQYDQVSIVPYNKAEMNIALNFIDTKNIDKKFEMVYTPNLLYLADMYQIDLLRSLIKSWILEKGDFSWYEHINKVFPGEIKMFLTRWVDRLEVRGLPRESYLPLFDHSVCNTAFLFSRDGHQFGGDVVSVLNKKSFTPFVYLRLAKYFGPPSYLWLLQHQSMAVMTDMDSLISAQFLRRTIITVPESSSIAKRKQAHDKDKNNQTNKKLKEETTVSLQCPFPDQNSEANDL